MCLTTSNRNGHILKERKIILKFIEMTINSNGKISIFTPFIGAHIGKLPYTLEAKKKGILNRYGSSFYEIGGKYPAKAHDRKLYEIGKEAVHGYPISITKNKSKKCFSGTVEKYFSGTGNTMAGNFSITLYVDGYIPKGIRTWDFDSKYYKNNGFIPEIAAEKMIITNIRKPSYNHSVSQDECDILDYIIGQLNKGMDPRKIKITDYVSIYNETAGKNPEEK